MNTATHTTHYDTAPRGWFSRAEAWLDARGKGAWIATMVVSFILFWPIGLALLAYMIWSKRMFSKSCSHRRTHDSQAWQDRHMSHRHGFATSGNSAFDAYKAETLRRLMTEQEAFEAFLERLRAAKDKSEFDQFMEERAEAARNSTIDEQELDEDVTEDVEILDEPKHKKK
ncbi:DUF2852 domain-containing protein [Aliiroseovarius sp. PrR006]|uniref:DUF2852 domain-containing protein n=1 Tax=Aliiroseovarius sp. PrR006 TaxID=2706883 RepID=UPI0013D18F98|nr:DUF2852 domain-containing protein [Aliiroseovarius sp. PrR006]NDW52360.1 DUF2852 domain-containing protein [Aliiroseovarius sp. PrR006]